MKPTLGYLRIAFSMICCIFLGVTTSVNADNPSDKELLEKLGALWDYQRDSVQSAVIKYRHTKRPASPNISRDDVLRLLKKADLVGNDAACKSLVVALDSSLQGQRDVWTNNKFTFEIIKEFNIIPRPTLIENATIILREEKLGIRRVTLKSGIDEAIVDEDTGFVYEYRRGLLNQRRYEETFQYAPTSYPGDVLLPSINFSATYRTGELQKFSLRIIDKATIKLFSDRPSIVEDEAN